MNCLLAVSFDCAVISLPVQERLDFAMKEIIYDLLCVGKSHKTFTINPEVQTMPARAHTRTAAQTIVQITLAHTLTYGNRKPCILSQ